MKRAISLLLAITFMLATTTSCKNKAKKADGNAVSSSALFKDSSNSNFDVDNSSQSSSVTVPGKVDSNSSESLISSGNSSENKALNDSSSKGTRTKNKILKIWWVNDDDKSMTEAVYEYSKIHPEVLITVVYPPEYTNEKFREAISAGTEPNIVCLNHIYITSLGKSGQLVDLNNYGAKNIESSFIPSCWRGVAGGGKTYGLPHSGSTMALMYNKTMLDSAKQSVPKTYEQLISVGTQLKKYIAKNKDKGDYAFTSPLFDNSSQGGISWIAYVYFFWLWRNGGEILNSDNTAATFNSPAGINALNQFKGLVTNGICAPSKYMESQFYNGTVGMIELGNWAIPNFTYANKNADFSVSMMPTLKTGVPNWSCLGLYALGITKKTVYKQEAFDFIKYFTTNDAYQLQYAKQHKQLPVTKSAFKDSYYSSSYWKIYLEQFAKSKSRPGVENWDEIEKEINRAVYGAVSGNANTKDALDSAAKRVNALLK